MASPFREQYGLIAAKLRKIKGKMIVSINDHPDIRRALHGFQMESLVID